MKVEAASSWRIRHLAILVLISAVVAFLAKYPAYLLVLASVAAGLVAWRTSVWLYRDYVGNVLGQGETRDGRSRVDPPPVLLERAMAACIALGFGAGLAGFSLFLLGIFILLVLHRIGL